MEQLDLELLDAQHFFLSRRDVSFYSKEDLIEDALNTDIPLERLNFYDWKDRKIIAAIRAREETQFTFFWETKSPFSQWHRSVFISSDLFHQGISDRQREYLRNSLPKELEFNSAEQFMMYHKAIIFLDREIAESVIKSSNVREIKELGRQVRNYDEDIWRYYRSNVVYAGNKLKFSQNLQLMDALMDTVGTTLVEAAPNDQIWGIGLSADDPEAHNRKRWKGKNLLGEILTLLRMDFMGMY